MTSNAIARHLIRKSLAQLSQGSTFTFRSHVPCSVVFQPEWRDDGVISYSEDSSIRLDVCETELQTSIGRIAPHISVNVEPLTALTTFLPTNNSLPQITVQVPEKINLSCSLFAEGSFISIPGKIEGDVALNTNGAIHAKKLRGHDIDLKAHSIIVEDLVEAARFRVKSTGRFRAKQVHCSQADIQVHDSDLPRQHTVDDPDDEKSLVDISALFISTGNDAGSGASIRVHPRRTLSHRAVRIKSNHGPVLIEANGQPRPTERNEFTQMQYPIVELGGVNGQCEVSIQESSSYSDSNWVSCQVHVDSLSAGSVSLVTADSGHVAITVDRKVAADLRLLSCLQAKETLLETGSLLAEEDDDEMIGKILKQLCDNPTKEQSDDSTTTKIQLLSPAFSKESDASFATNTLEYVTAVVENKSAEPDSRFDRQSGKVRIDGAGSQALSRFSPTAPNEHVDERPLFAVVGVGNIVLETVSWFGAIARRYGLEESERELGRTASRRGRLLVPPPTRGS
ncbi:hypothetical protein FisN_8Hh082 [Fistulifera solaris]|jgi:hypothetical protein|uniref:Adhesin domain-containing protein n=1 Tax=Fistulifera solaris TaxID=1519565 RepID=A0A1Z5JJR3_FISSO|nr:hypothetical protein FisN_8Hh082 [Fistulifera solaris]|eukprot:GAX14082.1 hypothetical protein FisN_8Hh082 [Fistulifera solaris]